MTQPHVCRASDADKVSILARLFADEPYLLASQENSLFSGAWCELWLAVQCPASRD